MTRPVPSLIVVALLLTACSDPQPPQQPEQPALQPQAPQAEQSVSEAEPAAEQDNNPQSGQAILYRCDDGTEFELAIIGSSAHMELNSTSYELRQQPAASGVYHAGDLWQVHSKAETALLIGPDSTRECDQVSAREVEAPPASPVESTSSDTEEAESGLE